MSLRKKRKLNSKQPFAKGLEQHVEQLYESLVISNNNNLNNNNPNNMLSPSPIRPRREKSYISTPDKSSDSHLNISNEELTRMYSDCIKLASENKINQKNSWQLRLIDYMEDVLDTQDESTNFQAASCALDASIKIYSCRVDSVHTDTYKVLGGLTRTERESSLVEENNEKEEESDDNVEVEVQDELPKHKRKRARIGSINTLESNTEALNGKKLDKEMLVDPLFQKTSAAFDQGGAKGLLLNHLFVQNSCSLVFDSADAIDSFVPVSSSPSSSPIIDVSDLQELLANEGDIDDIDQLELSTTFSEFKFDTTETPNISLDIDNDIDNDSDNENIDTDRERLSGGDLANFSPLRPTTNHENAGDGLQEEIDKSQHLPEFQFFEPSVAKKLLGSHWQFATPTPKNNEKKGRKRNSAKKPKKEFFIDFLCDLPPDSVFDLPHNELLISLPDSAYSIKASRLVTLPDDPPYDTGDLQKLFTKSKFLDLSINSLVFQESGEYEDYYGNGDGLDESYNDSANDAEWCSDISFNEGVSIEVGVEIEDELKKGKGEKEYKREPIIITNEKLVEKPNTVTPSKINFAKTAGRSNIQALKALIWKELCNKKRNNGDNNEMDSFEGEQEFATLMVRVGELAKKEKEKENEKEKEREKELGDVSVALCFISILHLCNEKGLRLLQDDINELLIVSN